MSTFVKYVDEVEITGIVQTGMWTSYDLSSFLQDTSAIGVTIRAFNDTEEMVFGARAVGADKPFASRLLQNYYVDCVVSFGGSGNTIEMQHNNRPVASVKVFVTGEIHDHAAMHDVPFRLPNSEPWNTWNDVQVTLIGGDAVGDIAAVIVHLECDSIASAKSFGLREKGSTRGTNGIRREGAAHWYVVGVDENGFYQFFTSGKASAAVHLSFVEIGYILKTGGIVTIDEPIGMALAEQNGSYAAIDFSAEVSSEAFIVGGRWRNPAGDGVERKAFLRATGSAENTSGIVINQGEHSIGSWVGVDADRKAEYQTETAATPVDFFVEWYEIGVVPSELFLWDADTRRVLDAGALATPALDAGSGARSPLEAAPGAPETPIDAEAETETPFDAEAETGPQEP